MTTQSASAPTTGSEPEKTSIVKVVFASLVGTAVEWYDFFLYGSAAALVFGTLFFPESDPVTAARCSRSAPTRSGFVARPLGGVVFGHFGDRVGRKKMLVVALMMMGVATFAIGLLPTYATIGVAAPILLLVCRLLQGFAVGGEWGGAVLMAAEHGDEQNRGFWSSWPQAGVPLGNLLATGVLFVLAAVQSDADFEAWGWRIPFLLSAVLVADRPVRPAAARGVAGLPGGEGRDRREEARRLAPADPRGDQDLPPRGLHRDGHADGGEHLLLHLHRHLDHLRHDLPRGRTRT